MNICVFGSASPTLDSIYYTETERLGRLLSADGHTLIFGGGKEGMMGAAARGFKENGAHITGVTPKFFLPRNVIYTQCDEMINHDTMRERKAYMEEHADAFVAAPGGIGTFEESFEVLTLINLGQMDKPFIFYDLKGFYTPLLAYLDLCIEKNFISADVRSFYRVAETAEQVRDYLR